MLPDVYNFNHPNSPPFLTEERLRPRAATHSMCRYTVPESPIRRPSVAPPNSPPSLILPPSGKNFGGLIRSVSKLSVIDERLASSAPSGTSVLSAGSGEGSAVLKHETRIFGDHSDSPSVEFTLSEQESAIRIGTVGSIGPVSVSQDRLFTGFDDQDDGSLGVPLLVSEEPAAENFGASPVLISCLRDISRMPRRIR